MNISTIAAMTACLSAAAFALPNRDGFAGVHKTQSAATLGEGRLQVTGYSHVINDERLLEDRAWIRGGEREVPAYFLLADNFLSLAYGFAERWDLGLTVPFYYEDLQSRTYASDGYSLGNAKVQIKYGMPLGGAASPIALGVLAGFSTPLSDAGVGVIPREMEFFPRNAALLKDGSRAFGVGGPEFFATLALSGDYTESKSRLPLLWHLNGGLRKVGLEFGDSRIFDDVGLASFALEYRPLPWLEVNGEFYHEARLDHFVFEQAQWESDPTTLTLGLAATLPYGVALQTGMVFGILRSGSTAVRAQNSDAEVTHVFRQKATVPASMVFALSWNGQVAKGDLDKDGVPNKSDKCPMEPEDKDGFQDEDGCPETDNDKDGIADANDKCPLLAEDMDGFEDQDGCPDLDNDKDGVVDAKDKCPNDAQGADGKDGCPNLDKDGDGIDNTADKCPADAEDKDGFQDDDGCPEPDNDKDGIADASDKCPNAPETMNGFQDEDGCPDVAIKKGGKLVLKGVYFKTGSAELLPESFGTLDTLAEQLANMPEVRLEVQGHTDNVGSAAKNKKLSAARAESVVQYLVSKGIAKERLRPFGYGSEKPMGDNKTAEGRAVNRRVELLRID
jgi:outer membrane protein OmpA-like peptidoglycan-associated protein